MGEMVQRGKDTNLCVSSNGKLPHFEFIGSDWLPSSRAARHNPGIWHWNSSGTDPANPA